ncbi:MAG: 4Fe-4S binding protein [Acidimicrobiales bacterium]
MMVTVTEETQVLRSAEEAALEEPWSPEDDASVQPSPGPVPIKVRLRPPERRAARTRFAETDPPIDVTRIPVLGKLLARAMQSRKFQFFLILPNQVIFWAVIVLGLVFANLAPTRSFGAAITWYVWFCLVFVMMVVVGRAWCSMCPFGGFGEWIQRKAFFKRTQKALGLGWKMPEKWAGYGLLTSVFTFIVLTWIEEFFNIAGPGPAYDTSFMVIGIVGSALIIFLLFERRTFCRYICPLSSLIGTVGAMGSVAGFRTRDREKCISCPTKDCMRGNEKGFGCPWYTWPGSADSNLLCGLCSECYKACPYGNIGLFVQKPLTSIVAPSRRRVDIALGVSLLLGLVVFQQVNALNIYASVDSRLTAWTGIPYPNPIDYVVLIAAFAAVVVGAGLLIRAMAGRRERLSGAYAGAAYSEVSEGLLINTVASAPSAGGHGAHGVGGRSGMGSRSGVLASGSVGYATSDGAGYDGASDGAIGSAVGSAAGGVGTQVVATGGRADRSAGSDGACGPGNGLSTQGHSHAQSQSSGQAQAQKNQKKRITSSWKQWYVPFAYALIPLTAADYLARQLPRFIKHTPRVVSSVLGELGVHTGWYNMTLFAQHVKSFDNLPSYIGWQIVGIQLGVMAVGLLLSLWMMKRIFKREMVSLTDRPALATAMSIFMVVAIGMSMLLLYIPMHAAS